MPGLKHFHNLVLRAFSSTIFKMVARHFEKWRLAFSVLSCDVLKTKTPYLFTYFLGGEVVLAPAKIGRAEGRLFLYFFFAKRKKAKP